MLRTAMICNPQPSTSTQTTMPTSCSKSQMPSAAVRQVVALAVISRLHEWCVQLFWITILCVIGCVGDEKQKCSAMHLNEERSKQRRIPSAERSSKTSKTKNIAEIEMKLLRHLTSPQFAACRPVVKHTKKRHTALSRPPSPQLFDITEEPEEVSQ